LRSTAKSGVVGSTVTPTLRPFTMKSTGSGMGIPHEDAQPY